MEEKKKESKPKKSEKKSTKKASGSGKVIIEGDFVDFKAGKGCHKSLVEGKTYNVTAQKAELFIKAGWGELLK